MKQDLKDKIKEYSNLILWGNDEEAEALLNKESFLKNFVEKYKQREKQKEKTETHIENTWKRVKLKTRLCDIQKEMSSKHSSILAKMLFEFDPDPEDLIEKYNQLIKGGMSSIASVAALCYEGDFMEDDSSLDLDSVLINYDISQSAHKEDPIGDINLVEVLYILKLRVYLEIEERKEFVLGLRAAQYSD